MDKSITDYLNYNKKRRNLLSECLLAEEIEKPVDKSFRGSSQQAVSVKGEE
jgi:hypothetical protein